MSLTVMAPARSPQTPPNSAGPSSDTGGEKTFIAGKDGTTIPSCYHTPSPPYTQEARAAKFEGIVLVEGIIMPDGKIQSVRIVKSPGLGLEGSVLSTLKNWKCKPATHEGKPVPVRIPIEFTFRLN
jgi:protein TonB